MKAEGVLRHLSEQVLCAQVISEGREAAGRGRDQSCKSVHLLATASKGKGGAEEGGERERGWGHSGPCSLPAQRRAPDLREFQVTHAGRGGVMLGQGSVNRAWSCCWARGCFLGPFLSPPPPCRPVLLTRTLALLPLLSLTICSSFLWLVPNLRLTSDRKLGEVPLVGVSSVPGLRLAALHAGDPYGLPWGCKAGCHSCPPPRSQKRWTGT